MQSLLYQYNAQKESGKVAQKKEGKFFRPIFQSKLSINQPGDVYEQEADAVAYKVMRMSDTENLHQPFFRPAFSPLQRKCTQCEEEDQSLLRKTDNDADVREDHAFITYFHTLSGGGNPLPGEVRRFFEPRMGYDFGPVRIHTDSKAAQSAASINALAYTTGHHIVFNKGQYQPDSGSGKRLLGHELVHVMQQAGPAVKRQPIEVDIMTEDPDEVERLRTQHGIQLPSANVVWTLLSQGLVTRIQQVLTQNGIAPPSVPANPVSNPDFVLHDTAITMSARAISNRVSDARGPLGGGAAAYVPGTGSAAVARSGFFDARRPTATEFEKGNDVLPLQQRLTNARIIWQNTRTTVRQAAMQAALAGLNLTPAEVTAQTQAATTQLNAATTDTSLVYSTGMWTVNEICNQITTNGIQNVVNNAANTQTLQTAYDVMQPFFATRNQRLATAVNIEIVQVRGGDCNPNGAPLPVYTASQYSNVALLYLQAALQADRFPRITTHFLVDKNAGSHCDPRCFNLTELYRTISTLLTFSSTTTFGIVPQYGTGASDNVWWSNTVCGGAHP